MGVIVLDGAGYAVAGKSILSGLSLTLAEPRIGIIGRNGSGKTSLLRLIAGLVAPTAGQVRVDGIDPFADRKGALAALGILFQNPDHQILFPTVEEELAFGLLFADRNHYPLLPQQQPVDDRLQHRRFTDADRAGQQQMATLARFASNFLDQLIAPNQAGEVFHGLTPAR